MTVEHSIIPPSSAYIWGAVNGCTGWALMAQQYPETVESESAREGSASHYVAEARISIGASAGIGQPPTVGTVAPNGVVIDDPMYEGAELYAQSVLKIMQGRRVFGGACFGIERKIQAPSVHAYSHGTLDAMLYDRKRAEIFLWDYKYGFVTVEVFENLQLVNYLAGLLDEWRTGGLEDQRLKVTFTIVQPRAYHRDGPVRTWSCLASDLRGLINILKMKAHEALGPNAQLHSGPHCRFCEARHACPAALSSGMGLYEICARPVAQDLSIESLATEYSIVTRAKQQIELLESGYAEQIESLLRQGTRVPGYVLQEGRGRETWERPIAEVVALGNMLGIPLAKPGALTPRQARMAGVDAEIVKAYAYRPKTGLRLAPDDTNRARRVFT